MLPFLFLLLSIVRGVVLDPTGRPVEGAKIACGTETSTTDSRGNFEFAKPCVATVEKSGFASKTIALTDTKDAEITLALAPLSDRVLVTSAGAPIAMEDAGVASTVFTSADFTARQFPFVQDLLRDVPGMSIVQTGRNGGLTNLYARGGDSDTTMVLLDGIPITDPGGSLDFVHLTSTGLDRLEVVRGPESALYGAEASSAVIQMFTQHGDVEAQIPHGSLLYERGSFSTDHWSGTIAGGLAKRIDYAFTADQFRSTGEFENDAYRITSGTANVGYHFSDSTILRAVFREFDSYTGVPGQVFYGLTDTGAWETVRDSALSVRLDDARGKRFTQKVIFGYHRNSTLDVDTSDGNPFTIAALTRTVPGPIPYIYFVGLVPPSTTVAPPGTSLSTYTYYPFAYDSPTLTDRTNVQYQGTWTHKGGALVFGYEYERQAGDITGFNVSRFDNGLFISDQYALTPRIYLTASARYQQSSTFGSEFAPRGAVTFRLPTETFLRFSASRGIKEPSLLENFAQAGYYVGNPALKPETTQSYEAGLSREWMTRRLRTELSIFRNSFHNLIEYDSAVYPGTWQNVDQSWARGAEASATLRITSSLAVRGAYTKLYTKITNSITPSEIGEELLRRPKNSGSVSLELTPKRWTLIAGGRFVGERQDEDFAFGVNRNPGYQYVFVNASYQATKNLEPFVRIQNALDQQYQEALGYSALSRSATGGLRITW
ncbi:MAG TPA: TonB-dependent receptor [Bryobacteraceae bacterium]|jgi:vitamin B12 transporter|nr:TonB-dependent receptor [Bryobacteraceae bacterium]